MRIDDQTIDHLHAKHKKVCGGVRNDYFGLAYLMHEYRLSEDEAMNQIAFGGNDYGIDGFHFDRERKNFYLFQFKYSPSYEQFKQSFRRLIDAGMARLFDAADQDSSSNQLVEQIKASLSGTQRGTAPWTAPWTAGHHTKAHSRDQSAFCRRHQ
jgi:hypothetical protein